MTTQRHAIQAYATAGVTRARVGFTSCLPVMWSQIGNDADPKHGQPLWTEESP